MYEGELGTDPRPFLTLQPELDLMKERIPELMKNAIPLDVPMEVETGIGENWLIAH